MTLTAGEIGAMAAAKMSGARMAYEVTASMMFAAVMGVAAVMMPAVPAFAATETETAAEFIADDVPAGSVPAVVIPTVGIAAPNEFAVAPRDRGRAAGAFDLQPRPAALGGTNLHSCQAASSPFNKSLSPMSEAITGREIFSVPFDLHPRPAVGVGNELPQLAGAVVKVGARIHVQFIGALASRNLPFRLSCSRDQPSAPGTSNHNWQEPLSKSHPGLRLSASLQNLASRYLPPPCCAEPGRETAADRRSQVGRAKDGEPTMRRDLT